MKYYSIIKTAVFLAILLTAMAFSCQDHHVPDPDPVSNCNRVDGMPRAFPCEFEVSKIEILRGSTDQISSVITPQQIENLLSMNDASKIEPYSGNDYFRLTYRTKVYVKRVSKSPMPDWNKYKLDSYNPSAIPDEYDVLPNNWPNPVTDYEEISSWAVGDTKVFDEFIYFFMGRVFKNGDFEYSKAELFMFIFNHNTSNTLHASPYNYRSMRDVSDGYLQYFLQMKE